MEVMKQGQFEPIPVEKQVAIIYTATKGYLDDIPVEAVGRFEKELMSYLESNKPELLEHIRTTKELPDEKEFNAAIEEFKKGFSVTR